jgi:hypothetical protein
VNFQVEDNSPSFVKGPDSSTVPFDSKNGIPADAQPIEVPYETDKRFEHKVAKICLAAPEAKKNMIETISH